MGKGEEIVLGRLVGVGAEVLAAVLLGEENGCALMADFDVIVGAVLDLADDLQLPLGPAVKATDADDAVVGFLRSGMTQMIRVAI